MTHVLPRSYCSTAAPGTISCYVVSLSALSASEAKALNYRISPTLEFTQGFFPMQKSDLISGIRYPISTTVCRSLIADYCLLSTSHAPPTTTGALRWGLGLEQAARQNVARYRRRGPPSCRVPPDRPSRHTRPSCHRRARPSPWQSHAPCPLLLRPSQALLRWIPFRLRHQYLRHR